MNSAIIHPFGIKEYFEHHKTATALAFGGIVLSVGIYYFSPHTSARYFTARRLSIGTGVLSSAILAEKIALAAPVFGGITEKQKTAIIQEFVIKGFPLRDPNTSPVPLKKGEGRNLANFKPFVVPMWQMRSLLKHGMLNIENSDDLNNHLLDKTIQHVAGETIEKKISEQCFSTDRFGSTFLNLGITGIGSFVGPGIARQQVVTTLMIKLKDLNSSLFTFLLNPTEVSKKDKS